jgi:hypothetical protein
MKQCFANATSYALGRDDVNYVEGFALDLDMPLPIQHAWIVDDRGQAIDPTWQENADYVYNGIPRYLRPRGAVALVEAFPDKLPYIDLLGAPLYLREAQRAKVEAIGNGVVYGGAHQDRRIELLVQSFQP